jgi:hypothetical protein
MSSAEVCTILLSAEVCTSFSAEVCTSWLAEDIVQYMSSVEVCTILLSAEVCTSKGLISVSYCTLSVNKKWGTSKSTTNQTGSWPV